MPHAVELPTAKVPGAKKIFISRSKASYRRMLNEADLTTLLEKRGFLTVHLEALSVVEQIALFQNADHIVASHGAGLTNLFFCKPDTKVTEIFQEHEDIAYWNLSQVIGLNHQCINTTVFRPGSGYIDTPIQLSLITDALDN